MKILSEISRTTSESGWPLRRVRDVAFLTNGFPFRSEDFSPTGEVPLVRIRDLSGPPFESFVPEDTVPFEATMRNGDLAIGMDGDFNCVLWDRGPAALNQRVCVLRPRKGLDIRFLHYSLPPILGIINDLTYSTTVKHLSGSDVLQQLIQLPSPEQQVAVCDYLDRETAQIDDLIGKQERLIELLAEKRQAVITQAVTKGLDPNAPTKPSNTPWLGDVPMHWSVPKLGMHSRIGNGSTPSRENLDYWQDGTIPWLNSSHVNRDEVTDSDQFVTSLAAAECHLPRVVKDNLIVGLTGQGRTRGMVSIVRFETTINQHVAYIAANGQFWEPEYLHLFLRAAYDHLREVSDQNGSTKGALTCAALKNLSVCLPPLSEQTTIATVVNATLKRIDSITVASQKAIDLLRERRSALISAAVTGKIDVREGVA